MGNYGWEHGRFVLPSAEFAGFRQAMQDADQARKQRMFDLTQTFWKGLTRKQQTNPDAYREAAYERLTRCEDEDITSTSWPPRRTPAWTRSDIESIEHLLLYKTIWGNDRKPRRLLKTDLDWPTNRTTTFTDMDCSVTFNREDRTVTWSSHGKFLDGSPGRDTRLAHDFFNHLGKVRWTHGTGGVISGNDEYSQHGGHGVGGGSNYLVGAYGYLGAQQDPGFTLPFTNARGQRVDPASQARRAGGQGRVSRGVPAGGQFATRGRGEAGVRL